ncbi:MAG: phosphatase [Firmicutes bacterium]|nr:phosphatase [Bacillota bacterium]
MKYILDIHCHTISSGHAYSTITENAAHAASVGLTHIGIADHGPDMPGGAHRYHFFNLSALPDVIHGVRILKGMEANILNSNGDVDFPSRYLAMMDFVIASMHREVVIPADRKSNTAALVNAMENPNIHVLGHPTNVVYDIDIEAVVKAAAKTRTIIEINNHSLIPGSFRFNGKEPFTEMLALCKEYGVQILASSDAHYHTSVGDFSRARPLIEEAGIPEELIINTSVEKLRTAIKAKSRG